MDAAAVMYKVSFEIKRTIHLRNVVADMDKWVVKVMGKKFVDTDFIKAAGEAVKLVYNAHKH